MNQRKLPRNYMREHRLHTAWSGVAAVTHTVGELRRAGYAADEIVRGALLPTVYTSVSEGPMCTLEDTVSLLKNAGFSARAVCEATGLSARMARSWPGKPESDELLRRAGYSKQEIKREYRRYRPNRYGAPSAAP